MLCAVNKAHHSPNNILTQANQAPVEQEHFVSILKCSVARLTATAWLHSALHGRITSLVALGV